MSETITADAVARGARALKQLQTAVSDICEVVPRTAEDDFRFVGKTVATGNALLADSMTARLEYDRTPAHIARGGLDHYQVTLCLQGEMQFASGRRELTLRPGDICLIDMAQPNRTLLTEANDDRIHIMSLILPRAVLAPRLAYPDSATASFLSGSGRHGRLLASQFAALRQPAVPEDSLTATVEAITDIVAAAAGHALDVSGDVTRAERHLHLAMIKRHIEANLDTDLLAADHLCRRFRISRASLYRLFEAEGGLARYVQEQRLNRALRLLISPASRGKRLINLAVELQFSSDSTFIRAFRRQFGLTPGEIRGLSEAWLRETGAVPRPDGLLHHLSNVEHGPSNTVKPAHHV
jgi:AraC-like DNA-binding protein